MRFEEAYAGWQGGRLRQEEAARLLGVCERSFRRYIDRYQEAGLEGLTDWPGPAEAAKNALTVGRIREVGLALTHFFAQPQPFDEAGEPS